MKLAFIDVPDDEVIRQFLDISMKQHRLNLLLHECAKLLGDETDADRPLLDTLVRKTLEFETSAYSIGAYAELLYLATLENESLKKQLAEQQELMEPNLSNVRNMLKQLLISE